MDKPHRAGRECMWESEPGTAIGGLRMTDETRFQLVGDASSDRITPIHGAALGAPLGAPLEASEATAGAPEVRATAAKHMVMLTNHGAALLYLHAHPDARVRDVANALLITERATARILADLKTSGHLRVTHANRRNRYEVTGMLPLHLGDDAARTMADLVLRISNLTMSAFIGGTAAF